MKLTFQFSECQMNLAFHANKTSSLIKKSILNDSLQKITLSKLSNELHPVSRNSKRPEINYLNLRHFLLRVCHRPQGVGRKFLQKPEVVLEIGGSVFGIHDLISEKH